MNIFLVIFILLHKHKSSFVVRHLAHLQQYFVPVQFNISWDNICVNTYLLENAHKPFSLLLPSICTKLILSEDAKCDVFYSSTVSVAQNHKIH